LAGKGERGEFSRNEANMAKKKTKARGTPARAKKRHAVKKTTTALVKRQVLEVLPAEPIGRTITAEGVDLGALGLVEVKLTDKEEAILAESVPIDEVLIKPQATPVPYLSHPGYTRWFNRAFGRTGWSLVPVGRPAISGKTVVCPYVLHIHRQPVALAYGEQEYHENNREQTYGDAIESTVASALRRCAKRLGVGLELWDKDWLRRFVDERCVRVSVRQRDKTFKSAWRRTVDPPLPFEQRGGKVSDDEDDRGVSEEWQKATPARPAAPPRREEPVTHAKSGERITDPQRRRLGACIVNSGRNPAEVQGWLGRRYGWKASAEITRDLYDEIIRAIEADATLPETRR